jgi:hypothetical protein
MIVAQDEEVVRASRPQTAQGANAATLCARVVDISTFGPEFDGA